MLNDMLAHKEDVFIVPEHMKERIRQGQEEVKKWQCYYYGGIGKKYEKWLKE